MKIIPEETNVANSTKHHKFEVDDIVELFGMKDHPKFNGALTQITNIRESVDNERAYYIKSIPGLPLNWLFEKRLKLIKR